MDLYAHGIPSFRLCCFEPQKYHVMSRDPYTIPAAQIQNPNAEIPNAEIPNLKSQIMISIFCRNPKSQIPNTSNLGFWRPKSQMIWDLGNTYSCNTCMSVILKKEKHMQGQV